MDTIFIYHYYGIEIKTGKNIDGVARIYTKITTHKEYMGLKEIICSDFNIDVKGFSLQSLSLIGTE